MTIVSTAFLTCVVTAYVMHRIYVPQLQRAYRANYLLMDMMTDEAIEKALNGDDLPGFGDE